MKSTAIASFHWEKGSLNDNGIRKLKELGLPFRYNFFKLQAYLGDWFDVEYHKFDVTEHGDLWIMEIITG